MTIKNIIFDFGNVLIDLKLERLETGFRALYGQNYEKIHQKLKADRVFELYETGGISSDEFLDILSQAHHPAVSREAVLGVWNSIFNGMPAARLEMLTVLRKRYKVFLLSNINDLHEQWIGKYLWEEHQVRYFEQRYFDGVYYSHLVRLRKPTREIYEYMLADAELVPEECLFIDDLLENLEAAKKTGINTIHHPVGNEITQVMQSFYH